jgi:hypothetical protein
MPDPTEPTISQRARETLATPPEEETNGTLILGNPDPLRGAEAALDQVTRLARWLDGIPDIDRHRAVTDKGLIDLDEQHAAKEQRVYVELAGVLAQVALARDVRRIADHLTRAGQVPELPAFADLDQLERAAHLRDWHERLLANARWTLADLDAAHAEQQPPARPHAHQEEER